LASRTRAPGQQVPPRYPRAGTPTAANRAQYSLDVRVNEGLTTDPRILYAQHQGHTTADPAHQAVQPPPEPARKLIDPARWVLGTPSRGAADMAKAGLIAAAPAPQKPPGPMTVTNDKIDTIIGNDQFNDPRWGQKLLINHAISARTAHENDSSRADLQKAEKENAAQLKMNNELIQSHMALLKRLNESKFANDHEKELRPYSSSPLFKSSYVNLSRRHGQRPTYVCKACNHETDILSNFKVHHKTKKHMVYLNSWNEEENAISIDLHDQPLSKKQKTVGNCNCC
jgi:hypothetical protein